MGVSACLRQCLSEENEAFALADFLRSRNIIDRVNDQGQGNHAVTTFDGLKCLGVGACLCQRLPEEVVAFALANALCNRCLCSWIHGEEERDQAVAAVGFGERVSIGSRSVQRTSVEIKAFALADFGVQIGLRRFMCDDFAEGERFFDGKSADVGAAHTDFIVSSFATFKQRVGFQFVVDNGEKIVVCGTFATYQLIHKMLVDVVIQGDERTDECVDWVVFVECRAV